MIFSDSSIQTAESLFWHLVLCLTQVQMKRYLCSAGCLEVARGSEAVLPKQYAPGKVCLQGDTLHSLHHCKTSHHNRSFTMQEILFLGPPRIWGGAKLMVLYNLLFSRSSCWRLSAPQRHLATRKGLNMPSHACSSLTCHQIRNQMGIPREGKISPRENTVSLKAR